MKRTQGRSQESDEPREEARARLVRLAPAVLGCVGVAGSLVIAGGLWFSERSAARADFELDSMKLMAAVGRELEIHLEQVRAAAALYSSSQLVDAHEFRTFTEPSFARYPALHGLFWIEVPPGKGSAPSVRLSEGPEARGSIIEAGATLGPVLARADQRRDLTLSAPIRSGSAVRVLALQPVYDHAGGEGFVGGLYDVERLFAQAKEGVGSTEVLLSAADAGMILTGVPAAPDLDPRHGQDFERGGRTWSLTCTAPPGFLAAHTSWRPWIVLGFGLLATGLLVATIVMATGRERILRLVKGRTEEVKQAYATLTHEAKERMWAINERRQVEQQLRAIVDLVPDRIFVKDRMGRFLLANRATAEAYGTTVEKLTATRNVDRNSAPMRLEEPLSDEQRAMLEQRPALLPELPFVDVQGRRRILRQNMIPCDVFGAHLKAMLCVATDITEQKQAEDVLRTQNRLLSSLASGEDPERVLAEIVHAAEALVSDLRCSVLFLAPDGRHLRHGFAPSLPDEYNQAVDGLEIGATIGSCGAAAALGERFVVADVMTHPNWEPFRDLAQRSGIGACWSQPIRAADGTILGTFALYYPAPRVPEPYEERFIESMAYMAGLAIERARVAS